MTSIRAVSLDQVCRYFNIELEIMSGFAEFGLFPVIRDEGETSVEIRSLERMAEIVSLHQALGINKEGIEVILNLRGQIDRLKDEAQRLQFALESMKHCMGSEDPEELRRLGMLIDLADT